MKTWERVILLILIPLAGIWHGIRNIGKYTLRKSKRAIAILVAITIMLSAIPIMVFADTGIDHANHSGYKELSMGETYIKVDGVEQDNNRLTDGSYYLTEDITVSLSVNGDVSLCLNGFSINTNSTRGIEFYTSNTSLTVDDCIGTGKIGGKTYAIYSNFTNTTVTINSGIIGNDNCTYGIYASNGTTITINGGTVGNNNCPYAIRALSSTTSLYINGGSIIGRNYGIYNNSDTKVYLSGTPAISGTTADIYGGKLYADNGAESPVPYNGKSLMLDSSRGNYSYHGDVMVSHVSEENKALFMLSSDFDKFSLVYDSDTNELKLEGEALEVTWYAEDGTTVLSGEQYPDAMYYRDRKSVMPNYEKDGYFFLGWLYREVGKDRWSNYYYDEELLQYSMEFKAVVLSKNLFEGAGTADEPYLIKDAEDLVALAQVVNDRSEYYNAETVYYQLAGDIDLSSVCGKDKENWMPIGYDGYFLAQFDGNGHTVSNLYYSDNKDNVGLFGTIGDSASIRNLTVSGFVSAREDFSGIAGSNYGGTVENCFDFTETVPYEHTTDENGWMAFKSYDENTEVDIKASYNGKWIKTSYDNTKQYKTELSGLDGASVKVTPTIINSGTYVKVLYTVTNNGDTDITGGKLAVHSDIQIGDNDDAAIEVIQNSDGKAIGFKMIDDHTTEKKEDCTSRGAQLNMYFAGTGGVTDADTYWFGFYGHRQDNAFKTISDATINSGYAANYEKDENGNYIKLKDTDSGIAFSWQNIELAAGESKEFSWVINVGVEADPPKWSDSKVNLTVTTDAVQNNLDINVATKVKDAAGVTDKLYYSVNNGEGVMLGAVIADGETEKSITGVINASSWNNGTYNLDFWVVNSKGAVSEKVRRTITIENGKITGDITVLNPELSHDWDTVWNYDETNHWHDCKNTNCTILTNEDKEGFAAHVFDNACDATCNTCGYTRAVTHTFNQKVMTERYLVSAATCTKRGKYYYSCTCGEAGTTTFFGNMAAHEYTYSAEKHIITETCKGDCGHSASATLVAPEDLIYNGAAKKATVSYSENWKGGALNVVYDSHGNVNAGKVTASITKNNKTAVLSYDITVAAAIVTPPVAKENLVYDGDAKMLISAGSTTGGTMQYAIGTSSSDEPTSGWSSDIPEGKAAGTYYVWYKVVGGTNYKNVNPACITVTIAKAKITVTADNKKKTYGENDPILTWSVTEGTVKSDDTLVGISVSRASGDNVGNYTITISQTANANSNYDITFVNGAFTVVQKEIGISWSNTNLVYNGTAQKPTAVATGVVNGDKINFIISGKQTDASDTVYTAEAIGIDGEKAGNYKLPTEKTTLFTIAKADPEVPTGIGKTDETISKKADGTITGMTNEMEYRKNGEDTYISANKNIIENLAAGIYYVRMKGDGNHNPSAETSITINAGRKLKIVVPAQQIGYTLTSTASEVDYLGAATLTFTMAEGYSKTDNFEISLNGNIDKDWINGKLSLSDISNDINITVGGVADTTAPTAEIKVKDNAWTSFFHKVTFGLFFKETQSVTITAGDNGSGVDEIQYYISGKSLKYEELSDVTDWKSYNDLFTLNPDNHYVVYAKVTDKAGNTLYISSDGLVFDSVAPVFYGIENGSVYYGDKTIKVFDEQHYPITFTVDGIDVTNKIRNDEYTIIADNKKHTLVATDKAGNVTEYKITVYKNYTVTYKIGGKTVSTETVGHGKNAIAPVIPEKEGYTQTAPVWDNDGKNITADTEINAVYTINEYKITFMYEHGVYKTLTYKHGDTVKMPDVPTKDGYTVKWDTIIRKATGNATIKAVYINNSASKSLISPKTGDIETCWLWIVLLFVSGSTVATRIVYGKNAKSRKTE